jgi:hypothetical protein
MMVNYYSQTQPNVYHKDAVLRSLREVQSMTDAYINGNAVVAMVRKCANPYKPQKMWFENGLDTFGQGRSSAQYWTQSNTNPPGVYKENSN